MSFQLQFSNNTVITLRQLKLTRSRRIQLDIWDKKEAFDELLFCIENFKNELISKYLNLKRKPGRFTFNGVENLQKKQFAEIIANGPLVKNSQNPV